MTNKKEKILVAMSGGVDSAVAASILVKKGYDVTGAFMVNYDDPDEVVGVKCWSADYQDALRVSAKLGIKLYRVDFVKEYQESVLNYLFKEYEAGRTPNPDIMCNKLVKFGAWLKWAKDNGFDKLATGHYAEVVQRKKVYELREAKDKDKDQTYFLHQLNQEQLSSAIFPLAKIKKSKVRELAKKWNLPVADKEESMGICLVGDVLMSKFLDKHLTEKPGEVILSRGDVISRHRGLYHFTIGQRYGLPRQSPTEVGKSRALFVIKKNIEENELVVGFDDDPELYKKEMQVKNINWIKGSIDKIPLKCFVRLRHRQPLQKCSVVSQGLEGEVKVMFKKKQRAVAPGQFAVFYKHGVCLGGGEIK